MQLQSFLFSENVKQKGEYVIKNNIKEKTLEEMIYYSKRFHCVTCNTYMNDVYILEEENKKLLKRKLEDDTDDTQYLPYFQNMGTSLLKLFEFLPSFNDLIHLKNSCKNIFFIFIFIYFLFIILFFIYYIFFIYLFLFIFIYFYLFLLFLLFLFLFILLFYYFYLFLFIFNIIFLFLFFIFYYLFKNI